MKIKLTKNIMLNGRVIFENEKITVASEDANKLISSGNAVAIDTDTLSDDEELRQIIEQIPPATDKKLNSTSKRKRTNA